MSSRSVFVTSEPVESALADRRPVVALESTIIAHGMPYPANVETARRLEATVTQRGATPATIAVIDGTVRVGLTDDELERLGSSDHVEKVSNRDLGVVLAGRALGATTVATTMHAAAQVGIQVFATGGIGGVHKDVADSHDISADLTALSNTPVAVVCAGVKSILDIGRTLEALETLGVPVYGFRTADFPAFYLRSSGYPAPHRLDHPEEVAAALAAHWASGLEAGAIVANPIDEAHEADRPTIEAAIEAGLAEAAAAGITGKETTPFLLDNIAKATDGHSLQANIELAVGNAALAAEIAVALAR
jgi:pseudouridine-5'-phosphate glycosidase